MTILIIFACFVMVAIADELGIIASTVLLLWWFWPAGVDLLEVKHPEPTVIVAPAVKVKLTTEELCIAGGNVWVADINSCL